MQHLDRRFSIAPALVLLGVLFSGCGAPTTPYLAPTAAPTAVSLVTARANAADVTAGTRPGIPEVTAGPTSTPSPASTSTLTATLAPIPPSTTPTSSPLPADPTATRTATTTPGPSWTPVPATAVPTHLPSTPTQLPYRFLPAGPAQPDPSHPCPGCPLAPAFIVGRVVDAAGNPLAGARLVCYNEWHRYPVVGSKAGGEYDFIISQAETTWYVVVLDETGEPISPEAPVPFKLSESCRYVLNWQQAN